MNRAVLAAIIVAVAIEFCLVHAALDQAKKPRKAPEVFHGTVVRVIDGDTFWVERPNRTDKIRLRYVDAPELKQPGGLEAKDAAESLVLGKRVSVLVSGKSYGRYVGQVTVNGVNLGEELILQGQAMVDPLYTPENSALWEIETDAREARRGIWEKAGNSVEPPWEWRKRMKREAARKRRQEREKHETDQGKLTVARAA